MEVVSAERENSNHNLKIFFLELRCFYKLKKVFKSSSAIRTPIFLFRFLSECFNF